MVSAPTPPPLPNIMGGVNLKICPKIFLYLWGIKPLWGGGGVGGVKNIWGVIFITTLSLFHFFRKHLTCQYPQIY